MKWLIELIQRMIIGIEIGTCCFVWIGIAFNSPISISLRSLILITIMSAIIGGATFIFRIPKINYLVAILIHYLITITINILLLKPALGKYFHLNFQLLILITFIYCVIWLVMRFMQINDVQRVNHRLKQRQNKN